MTHRSVGLAWVLAVTLISLSGCAMLEKRFEKESPRRVTVLELRGVKGLKVRNAIEGGLGDNTVVVSRKEYKKAARRLRSKRLRPRDIAKVAAELDLDVVIHGKRRKQFLHLVVRDGETGKVVAKHRLRLRKRRRFAPKAQKTLSAELSASLKEVARAQDERKREAHEERRIAEHKEEEQRRQEEDKREQRAAKERAAEEKKQAQEEQKLAAEEKKQAEKKKKKAEEEPPVERAAYDDSGQAIDDEMPDALGK